MTKDATPDQPTPEQPTPEGVDATEVFSTQDSTQALPAAEQTDSASPEHAWTAADQAEHELRAPADAAATGASPAAEPAYAASAGSAYAAPAGASQPPVPPRSGFWGRVGQAWRRVWASTLGKVAVIGAAALAVFAVIAAIALGAFFGGRGERMADRWEAACLQGQGQGQGQGSMGHPGRQGRGHFGQQGQQGQRGGMCQDDEFGPGRGGMGDGQGNGMGKGMGNGMRGGQGDVRGNTGGLGALPLGQVLHGEVVVGGTNARTVLYQVGEVTEYTAGASLKVKSSDGFEASYVLNADTAGRTAGLATGATVRVVADKEGAVATRVVVVAAGN